MQKGCKMGGRLLNLGVLYTGWGRFLYSVHNPEYSLNLPIFQSHWVISNKKGPDEMDGLYIYVVLLNRVQPYTIDMSYTFNRYAHFFSDGFQSVLRWLQVIDHRQARFEYDYMSTGIVLENLW